MVFLDYDEACDFDDHFLQGWACSVKRQARTGTTTFTGGSVTIPEVSREELLKAIEKFDQELRDSPDFADWQNKLNYRYAIDYEGRRYPVLAADAELEFWPHLAAALGGDADELPHGLAVDRHERIGR
jgi:hypothetical protein